MITRTCHQCHAKYETYPSVKPKFCSSECAGKAKIKGSFVKCLQCGKKYWKLASKPTRKYCSLSCSMTARNLTDENPVYSRNISGKNNPMFGVRRFGKDNPMFGRTKSSSPRWTGGRKIRKDGYVLIVAPNDHPYPAETKESGTKYILEHRRILECHLLRYLEPGEVVHHRDNNPSNNAIDNLELFSSQSEHIKQRHS